MINCRFKPVEKWPSKPTDSWRRQNSRFKADWQQTLDLLERELNHLRAKDITIEGFFALKDIRNDGWPKSSARPTQPGVILSFTARQGRMVMPCDKYKDWESNLRAVALTLEHLRAVKRYGVTTEKGEQYTGWLRLPASTATDEAYNLALVLVKFAQINEADARRIVSERDFFDSTWREAVRRTHPDNGGIAAEFQQAMNARERLKEMKGWA